MCMVDLLDASLGWINQAFCQQLLHQQMELSWDTMGEARPQHHYSTVRFPSMSEQFIIGGL